MKKHILFLSIFFCGNILFSQQYPLFTNYLLNDFGFNPAIAGSTDFIDVKMTYRTQWVGIEDAPKTQIFSVQGPMKKLPIGLGGYIFNDVAGQIKRTGVSGALCYGIPIGEDKLGIGASFGYYNLRLNEVYFAKDQLDPTLMEGANNNWTPDLSLGLYYKMKSGLFIGVSAPQLLRQKFDYEDDPNGETTDFVPHYYGMLGYSYQLNEKIILEPTALLKYVPDAPFQVDLSARAIFNNKYWVGGAYRSEDAASIMLGIDLTESLNVAYAYDFILSELNNGTKGSHEITLGLRLGLKKDSDGDGILDKDDECPDEPGTEENNGCPEEKPEDLEEDNDEDGVLNKDDECPDVPGPKSNSGCPLVGDRDKDGLRDDVDECPDEPGPSSNAGCPLFGDRDKDGLRDDIDECPTIPGLAENKGCPLNDRDKDGIIDEKDKCPDEHGPLKFEGCPLEDKDGDGVPDIEDECPSTAGRNGKGCPEATKAEKAILDLAIRNLYFDTDKAIIRTESFKYLDKLAEVMVDHPDWKISMTGHADYRGSDEYNLDLSKRRVEAAMFYLINRGLSRRQLITEYYGEQQPAAPNSSESTLQLNRRVEMEFVFQ